MDVVSNQRFNIRIYKYRYGWYGYLCKGREISQSSGISDDKEYKSLSSSASGVRGEEDGMVDEAGAKIGRS